MATFVSKNLLNSSDVINFIYNEGVIEKVVGRDTDFERMSIEAYFEKRKNLSFRINDYEFVITKVSKDSREVEYDFSVLWQKYLFRHYKDSYKEALLTYKKQKISQIDAEHQENIRRLTEERNASIEKINFRIDGVINNDKAMQKHSIINEGTIIRIEYN